MDYRTKERKGNPSENVISFIEWRSIHDYEIAPPPIQAEIGGQKMEVVIGHFQVPKTNLRKLTIFLFAITFRESQGRQKKEARDDKQVTTKLGKCQLFFGKNSIKLKAKLETIDRN